VGAAVPLSAVQLGRHLTHCRLGRGVPPYQVASWLIQPFGHHTPTLQTYRQDRQDNGPVRYGDLLLVTVAPKPGLYTRARPLYGQKYGDETRNSFTPGVIGVAVSGQDEATSGLAKLLPVERLPLPV